MPHWNVAMLRIIFAALSCLALQTPVIAQTQRDPRLDQIATDVRDARNLARSIADPNLRKRIDLLLARAELSARELQPAPSILTPPAAPPVMSGEDLQTFLGALDRQSFDDGKLRTVKTLVPGTRLRSEQAKQILARFTFDKDRMDAAIALRPLLVDPQLFALVLEAFQFDSNRKEVLRRIGVR